MTVLTRSRPGPPTDGWNHAGDTLTDSLGNKYKCVVTGSPGVWIADATPIFPRVPGLPAASEALLGQVYIVEGIGPAADTLSVCIVTDNSGPTYGWASVTLV